MQKRTTTTIKGHQVENVSAKTRAFESNQKLWFPKQKTVASPSAFPSICCWSTIQHVKHNEDLHTYWPLVVGLYLQTQRDRRENIYTHTTIYVLFHGKLGAGFRHASDKSASSHHDGRIGSRQNNPSPTTNFTFFHPSIICCPFCAVLMMTFPMASCGATSALIRSIPSSFCRGWKRQTSTGTAMGSNIGTHLLNVYSYIQR